MKKYLFIVLLVGVCFGQIESYMNIESSDFLNPEYSGSEIQNMILFELFPSFENESFKKRQEKWQWMMASYYDDIYDYSKYKFPSERFKDDPAYYYWSSNLNEKSDTSKTIYKNLYNNSIARLKYAANKSLDKKVFKKSTFKVKKGSYSFTTNQIGNKFLSEKAMDEIRDLYVNFGELAMKQIILENSISYSNHYIVNYPKYGIVNQIVKKPWKNDYLFWDLVKKGIFNNSKKIYFETNEPGNVIFEETCSKQNYILNIYSDGSAELIDQDKNKTEGQLNPLSTNESDIIFNSSEISKVKIKVKNDGNISAITLKNKCSDFSSLPVRFKNKLKKGSDSYFKKNWIRNGYVKINGTESGYGKSTIFVNFSIRKTFSFLSDPGREYEMFPIFHFERNIDKNDQWYFTVTNTYGYFELRNVFLKSEEYKGLGKLPHLITKVNKNLAKNLNVPYEEIKIQQSEFGNWIDRWMRDNVYSKQIKENYPLPQVPNKAIQKISWNIRDELSNAYYIIEKAMTQKEIDEIVDSSNAIKFINKLLYNILVGCLAIVLLIAENQ